MRRLLKTILCAIVFGVSVMGTVLAFDDGTFDSISLALRKCKYSIVPQVTNKIDLGDSTHVWKTLYVTSLIPSGNITMVSGSWIGLGSAKGRLGFTDATTDTLDILTADLIMGSATVDTGALTMIKGAQTSDPQVTFVLSADANGNFGITADTGDITLTAADDIFFVATGAVTEFTLGATGKIIIEGDTIRTGTTECLDIDATIDTTTATDDVTVVTNVISRAALDTGGTRGSEITITTGNQANGETSYNYGGTYNSSASATATSNAAVFYAGTSTVSANSNDYGLYIAAGYDTGIYNLSTTATAGLTNTGTEIATPSADQTLAAANTIAVAAKILRVAGNGGAVILTSTPSVAAGTDGQIIIIQGTHDTNTVKLQDEAQLASSGLALSGGEDFILGAGDTIMLIFDAGDSKYYEVSRSDN